MYVYAYNVPKEAEKVIYKSYFSRRVSLLFLLKSKQVQIVSQVSAQTAENCSFKLHQESQVRFQVVVCVAIQFTKQYIYPFKNCSTNIISCGCRQLHVFYKNSINEWHIKTKLSSALILVFEILSVWHKFSLTLIAAKSAICDFSCSLLKLDRPPCHM